MDQASALVRLRQERDRNRHHAALEILVFDSEEMTTEDMRALVREIFAMDEDED